MRPDFLVHWTGKDIATNRYTLDDRQRTAYLARLESILKDGFWMTKPEENIYGYADSWIKYHSPMTCFTEIRLSQAQTHTQRYGLLGVGVRRCFVLDRFGGPVHYVRNHSNECVVGNLQAILEFFNKQTNLGDVNSYFAVNSAFVKAMSERGRDDFLYLDEHEWRIVHTFRQAQEGKIVKSESEPPPFRIPVGKGDVKIIVFPDVRTRSLAFANGSLAAWLRPTDTDGPILLTVEECEHF